MFDDARLRDALRVVHTGLPDQLCWLLDDPYGMNLRNIVAHGIIANDGNVPSRALLALLVLLTLAALRPQESIPRGAVDPPGQLPRDR